MIAALRCAALGSLNTVSLCFDRTSPVLSLVQLFRRALQALDLLAGLQSDVLQLVPQFVLVLGLIVIPGGEANRGFTGSIQN